MYQSGPRSSRGGGRYNAPPLGDIEIVDCFLCGPAPSRPLRLLRIDTSEGPLRLRRCRSCGLVFMSPRYTQRMLRTLFDVSYFEEGGYSGSHHARSYFDPIERDEKMAWSRRILVDLETFVAGADLLEVGAAGGHFLLAARERGFRAMGVELSDYAGSQARERYGLDVRQGQLEECRLPAASFDVVYLNDLLEHVPDPLGFLAEVARVLKPGGVLYVVVPTYVGSLPTRLFAPIHEIKRGLRRARGQAPGPTFLREPFHIYEFTPATLRHLFRRAGFDVISMVSSMPSIQSGHRSELSGLETRLKLGAMRLYASLVERKLMWGERTRVVARPGAQVTS